jgi:hypothetical protein
VRRWFYSFRIPAPIPTPPPLAPRQPAWKGPLQGKGDEGMAHTPGPKCHRCLPASRSLLLSRARLFVILPLPRICACLWEENKGAGANSGRQFAIAYLPLERPPVTMYVMRCRAQSAPINTLPIIAFDNTRSSPIEKYHGSFDVSYDAQKDADSVGGRHNNRQCRSQIRSVC